MAFSDVNVGDSITKEQTITDDMVREFVRISGDDNPIHVDDDFAKNSIFKKRIVHGMLTVASASPYFFELCGYNYVLVNMNIDFIKPVFINETVTTSLNITNKEESKKRLLVKIESRVGERLVGKGSLLAQYIG